jgi:hypothetical protein
MSDVNKKTEDEDDDIVVVETDGAEQEESEKAQPADDDDDDDDDDGDESRMGVSEDDSEGEIVDKTKRNRDTRTKRRQLQKMAKERSQQELAYLRQQNAELMRRMSAVEGNTLSQNAAGLESQMRAALQEARQAEIIMAKAIEAGNGDDVTQALRIRDEARARAEQINAYKQRVEQAAKQTAEPRVDPRVQNYAQQWLTANPWYDPSGRDEDSAVTKAIDDRMVREGWDPASMEYWQELTRRVARRVNDGAVNDEDGAGRSPRRKAPPTGNTREHAPTTTRNEVVVTPERKQAMIEAGVWDDPSARKRYLKAYQEYDRNSAR